MHGPVLAMPPIFNEQADFHRARSSSNVSNLANIHHKHTSIQDDELPRSASFSSLPVVLPGERQSEKAYQALKPVHLPNKPTKEPDSQTDQENKRISRDERPRLERIGRRKSLVARPKSWIRSLKSSPERQLVQEAIVPIPDDIPPVPPISKLVQDNKTKTVSESFATFAKKSWISSSRSPSPSRRVGLHANDDGQSMVDAKMAGSLVPPDLSKKVASRLERPHNRSTSDIAIKQPSRREAFHKRRSTSSVLMSFTTFSSINSSSSSLPQSSLDELSTPRTSTDKVPPIPAILNEKLQSASQVPRKRDELWSAFRSLENDYAKFQAKSWSLKTNVVRFSLLPFLRNHAAHSSNHTLRPEDLERRVIVLNKWWIGLLDVLDGRQNQTVSGVDRPVLLDACYAIMTRPEWRVSLNAHASRPNDSPSRSPERYSALHKKCSNSLEGVSSQSIVDSIHHNTRNLFVQNLTAQMNFVVEKMSLRHAPASLVTFCGKAAAYAFFFVPGIAEILIRIWKLTSDTLRRVTDGLGMSRCPNKVETDEVIAQFPTHIHGLGWTSVKAMAALLKQIPVLPPEPAKIQWRGPWIARWCGRDSDLFFVFAKHYHILAEEFMPAELSLAEKARAPGFVLIQAQILTTLDATIHRQPVVDPFPVTFDDVLAGADTNAAALPLPSNNSARLMAENRLIMLLRDFVSERPSDYEIARMTFAESFSSMMQAAARKTSLFDHNACFVLCDFMEEALTIFVRYHHARNLENDFINWPFWMDVCQKISKSENSMSEIRLFALLYSTWNIVCRNERRKEILCLEWLLTEETFDKFFNHWCPMVRAYYMRLLCWRICRDDGEATELDIKVFHTVSIRVKNNWAYYLFLKHRADISRNIPPSSSPCHPAPGRRLLILRNDNQSPSSNLFLGFDGLVTAASAQALKNSPPTASKRHSSLSAMSPKVESADIKNSALTTDPSAVPNKKRWTFMGKSLHSTLAAMGTPSTMQDATTSSVSKNQASSSPTNLLEDARKETAAGRTRPQVDTTGSYSNSVESLPGATHRAFSFKFSLEWTQHFDRPANFESNQAASHPSQKSKNSSPPRGNPGYTIGPDRRLASPRLPASAQSLIALRVPGVGREILPRDPKLDNRVPGSTYAGRALAEWGLVVLECNGFVERRRSEGVPGLKWVEVPTLGVEGFRKFNRD